MRTVGSGKRNRPETKPLGAYMAWGLVCLAMLFAAVIRLKLLQMPLERDEGEFAYMGQLILHGIPPYKLAYNMKLPGIYAAYALVMAIFGQTIAGVHLGLLLVNAAAIVLVFLLARRLFDAASGIAAAAAYAVLSLGTPVLGLAGHATHFVVFFALGGTLLLLKAIESDRPRTLFWSGALFGLGFLMKQPGAVFAVFAAVYLVWAELVKRGSPSPRPSPARGEGDRPWRAIRRVALFMLGAAVPFGVTCLVLWHAGVFDKFWFWTFSYAREYGARLPICDGLSNLRDAMAGIMSNSGGIWALAGIGVIVLLWERRSRMRAVFTLGFLIFSFLAVCPGLYFRGHYFVLMLPTVALLTGVAVSGGMRLLARPRAPRVLMALPVIVLLMALGHSIYCDRAVYFEVTPGEACRAIYGANPFPESPEIARYIETHSFPSDTIAVIGSEPQIYFYSRRRSATGYIYTYPLMENQAYAIKMQHEMIREVEAARPKFMVLVGTPTSWVIRPESNRLIFDWSRDYARRYYEVVGVIDILSSDSTLYLWDSEAAGYRPRSPNAVYVMRRNQLRTQY